MDDACDAIDQQQNPSHRPDGAQLTVDVAKGAPEEAPTCHHHTPCISLFDGLFQRYPCVVPFGARVLPFHLYEYSNYRRMEL